MKIICLIIFIIILLWSLAPFYLFESYVSFLKTWWISPLNTFQRGCFSFWFARILCNGNHPFVIWVVGTFFYNYFVILFDLAYSDSSCHFDRNVCFLCSHTTVFSYSQIHSYFMAFGSSSNVLFHFFSLCL